MATADPTVLPKAFKFTRTSLAAAIRAHDEAGSTQVVLRDEGMTGLIARKQRASWVLALERKIHGKVRRATLEQYDPAAINVAKLRQDATAVLVELQAGTWQPAAEKREEQGELANLRRMTLKQAIDLLPKVKPDTREGTLRSYRWAVRYMTEGKDMRIAAFDTPTAQAAFNRIVREQSHSTALMAMRSCRSLWTIWAKQHPDKERPTTPNPFGEIAVGRAKAKRRTGALPSAKRAAWIAAARAAAVAKGPTGTAYNAVVMLALTGFRLNEVLQLRWDEVDMEAGEIVIPAERMKAHEELRRPITPLIRSLLKRQRDFHGGEGWVFPARSVKEGGAGHLKDVRKAIEKVCETVETDLIRPHDLRRTFVGSADMAGVPQNVVKTLVGHASGEDVTDDYARNTGVDLLPYALEIEAFLTGGGKA